MAYLWSKYQHIKFEKNKNGNNQLKINEVSNLLFGVDRWIHVVGLWLPIFVNIRVFVDWLVNVVVLLQQWFCQIVTFLKFVGKCRFPRHRNLHLVKLQSNTSVCWWSTLAKQRSIDLVLWFVDKIGMMACGLLLYLIRVYWILKHKIIIRTSGFTVIVSVTTWFLVRINLIQPYLGLGFGFTRLSVLFRHPLGFLLLHVWRWAAILFWCLLFVIEVFCGWLFLTGWLLLILCFVLDGSLTLLLSGALV